MSGIVVWLADEQDLVKEEWLDIYKYHVKE